MTAGPSLSQIEAMEPGSRGITSPATDSPCPEQKPSTPSWRRVWSDRISRSAWAREMGSAGCQGSRAAGILKGDRAGQHSIRVNNQFRVCFRWTDTGAEDVEIVDYH